MLMGVFKTSLKENERRIPMYPEHFKILSDNIRKNLILERGYGEAFGYDDSFFKDLNIRLTERDELFEVSDIILLPKPVQQDLRKMKRNQVLLGWPHCVQQRDITQIAIDKELTMIAFEAMHVWSKNGEKLMHVFYKNNEIAGYSAVLHVLQLLGVDGHYGERKRVAVIGFGSVSKGAIYALQGRGFNFINVYTQRPFHLVSDQNPDVYYHHYYRKDDGSLWVVRSDYSEVPMIEELSKADIICNGILQNTDDPITFVNEQQIEKLRQRSVIIDISCDEGMGFYFAKPTTFEKPIFTVGKGITYYSVDHTPSYLWHAASRELSRGVLPYIPVIMGGKTKWMENSVVSHAVEILDGRILNRKIINFQNREENYPHAIK